MFAEAFRRTGGLWIMKPVGRCQGRGIFVVDRVSRVAAWKKANDEREPDKREIYIVSKYIEQPLLIGGKKFDLRLYALVLSYSPLKVYLHRGGFARFSAVRYTNDKESMKDLYVHLTNVAIQKKACLCCLRSALCDHMTPGVALLHVSKILAGRALLSVRRLALAKVQSACRDKAMITRVE